MGLVRDVADDGADVFGGVSMGSAGVAFGLQLVEKSGRERALQPRLFVQELFGQALPWLARH